MANLQSIIELEVNKAKNYLSSMREFVGIFVIVDIVAFVVILLFKCEKFVVVVFFLFLRK